LLFGYDSAVISGATDSIKMNFVAPMHLEEGARLSLEGFTIAGALWGCLIGGAIGGVMAHFLGRRGGLIVAGVLFFISSLGSAWPESTLGHLGSVLTPLINALIGFLNLFFQDAPYVHFGDTITNFIGHRLFGGMGIGLASMLAPMYIAEIAPPSKRGALVTYQQIAIVSGITISYFVNYFIKKWGGDGDPNWVHDQGWRWMLACCAIPAGIFVFLLFFVPETPRGLAIKGKNDKAREVLAKLANEEEAKIVLAEIDASLKETAGHLFSYGGLVIVVGILLSAFQQLVGINSVLYYGPSIFEKMGYHMDAAFLGIVVASMVNLACTMVVVLIVDKVGRKPLLIFGGLLMGLAMLALGSLFRSQSAGAFGLAALCCYMAGFALSFGPIVWIMMTEIYPAPIRGQAMSIAVASQWVANLLVSGTCPLLLGNATLNAAWNHAFPFWLYGAFGILAAFVVLRYVPETRGVDSDHLSELWKREDIAAALK